MIDLKHEELLDNEDDLIARLEEERAAYIRVDPESKSIRFRRMRQVVQALEQQGHMSVRAQAAIMRAAVSAKPEGESAQFDLFASAAAGAVLTPAALAAAMATDEPAMRIEALRLLNILFGKR